MNAKSPEQDRTSALTRRQLMRQAVRVGAGLTALSVAGPLAACTQPVAAAEVRVGFLWPLTGASAEFAEKAANAFKLVFDDVNAKGGIKSLGGAKLKAVILDTETKVDVAASRAEQLANQGVVCMIGSIQSAAGVVIAPVAERNKVIYLTPMDAVDSLTAQGYKYFYRVCLPISGYARELVAAVERFSKSSGAVPARVAALHEDSIVGTKAAEVMLAEAQKYRLGEVVGNIGYPLASTTDFTGMVSKLKADRADLVFQLSYAKDAILITQTMNSLGFRPMAIAGVVGGHGDPGYVKALGPLAENTLDAAFYSPDLKTPLNVELNGKYKQAFGIDMDSFAAVSMCTAGVLVDALERAGSTDREKFRDALAKTDLKVGQSYYVIPDGCKFDETGQNVRQKSVVIQVQGGAFKSVYPEGSAAASPVFPQPTWKRG